MLIEIAVFDQPQRATHRVTLQCPLRKSLRALRATSTTGPETGILRTRRAGEITHILFPRHAYGTGCAAVDPGSQHRDEKMPIESRVATLACPPTDLERWQHAWCWIGECVHENDYNPCLHAKLLGIGHLSYTQTAASSPVRLVPVHIKKPWGQEIWYTGMEARGESEVVAEGIHMPISEYLATHEHPLGDERLLLLKILDPKPTPVLGDLYFEVHETKREVYIVTHVDRDAWPDGVGGIRFGMNAQKLASFASEDAFRSAYLEAVRSYETIRRAIDHDTRNADLAPALADREKQAREVMESFTDLRELRVGDVVSVPTWTPHSLQHGVRVVEFQTPTYERLIVSFAQKVLTQDHWDTQQAVAGMHLSPPAQQQAESVSPGIERVARFEDFNVWRIDGNTAGPTVLPQKLSYAVCMCITGSVALDNLDLAPEQAALIPREAIAATAISGSGQWLLAAPDL